MKLFGVDVRLPTGSETNAGLRHVYSVVGTVGATVVVLGLVTQGDMTTITEALHKIGDGVSSIIAGLSMLIPVVSGIVAGISASRKSRLASLAADPEVKQIVVKTPEVAESVTSNKVVSTPTAAGA